MEAVREEIRERESVHGDRIAAQPLGDDQEVEICADGKADAGPARVGKTRPIREAGQAHQQIAGHIRGLRAECRDPRAEAAAAEEIGLRVLIRPSGKIDTDPRFSPAGVLAPKSKADLAFIMHSLAWLATNGTAAIVCFPGIMYRGGAEKKIRQYLIDNNFIDCIIQLPSNLFFGTTIATCIMVLKRSKADNRTLFIDATNECVKVTNNNKLTDGPDGNIAHIVDAFVSRADKEHFARCVPYEEIVEQDYNLSVSSYIEQEDTREEIDIVKLNKEIEEIVAREQVLRVEIAKIIAELEG